MDREQTTAPLTDKSDADADAKGKYSGPPKWRSQRFILAYMIMLGNAAVFSQRVSFSMVIVCMVNHTALAPTRRLPDNGSDGQGPHSTSSPLDTNNVTLSFLVTTHRDMTWKGDDDVVFNETGEGEGGVKGDGGQHCDLGESPPAGHEEKEDGPFVWDKATQGLLLGAVYWGYMVAQIIAAYFIYFFGARRVCMVSVFIMSALTVLCHPAALWSPWAVFTLRVLVGICTAFGIPAMYGMWGQWAPVGERATLVSLSFSGQNIANAVAFPTAALLCKYGFLGGWPSVFYVTGILGVVWCVAWKLVVSDTPETLTRIDPDERDYIVANRGHVFSKGEKIGVPWCTILTSMCFWAIAVAHFSFTWGLFLFMSNLPLYMYEVMKFDIKSNGLYSMMPYIALGCVQMISGFVSDVIVKKKVLNVFWARRLFCCMSNLVPAVCVVIMSFLDCRHVAAIMCLLVTAVGFTGFAFAGFLVNPYDIAPRYAVTITSLTNSLACVPGILTPYVVAEVTKDQTREQWQIIFFITATIYVVGALFFCIFAKTSPQPWAVLPAQQVQVNHLDLDKDLKVKEDRRESAADPEAEVLFERPDKARANGAF